MSGWSDLAGKTNEEISEYFANYTQEEIKQWFIDNPVISGHIGAGMTPEAAAIINSLNPQAVSPRSDDDSNKKTKYIIVAAAFCSFIGAIWLISKMLS